MNFVPDLPKQAADVPFFEDVEASDGWQGQTTQKSMDSLKSEVAIAVSRLGGIVVGFVKGSFDNRMGFRLHYTITALDGMLIPGQIDIAALPVRGPKRHYDNKTKEHAQEQSLKMALFMFRNALSGLWFLQQLSPGYAPLMPFMIMQDGKTVTQIWSEQSNMKMLVPPKDGDFVEGEVVDG